jgi:hypothetical protein
MQQPLAAKITRAHQHRALKDAVAYIDEGGTDIRHVRDMLAAALPPQTASRELPEVGKYSERLQEKLRQRDEWNALVKEPVR